LKDKQYETSRRILNGKAIELREHGFGKKKNKSDALTAEEEEQLWQKDVLGSHDPISLNYTIFFPAQSTLWNQGFSGASPIEGGRFEICL